MTSKNHSSISQTELERRLNCSESLEGVVIGDVDFSNRSIHQNWNFSGARIQGTLKFWKSNFAGNHHLNFGQIHFSGNAYVSFVETNFSNKFWVNFSQSKFSDEAGVDFSKANIMAAVSLDFTQAKFSGKACVCFTHTHFSDMAQARFGSNTTFSDESYANFPNCKFSGGASAIFSGTQFINKARANFSAARFSEESYVDFSNAKFSNETHLGFSRSQLLDKSHIYLHKIELSGETGASFCRVRFSNETGIDFSEANFSEKAWSDFSEAQFLDDSELSWIDVVPSNQSQPWFKAMRCEPSAKIRFESSDLSQASFYKADIERFTFKNIKWGKILEGFVTRFVLKDEILFETNESKKLQELDKNEGLDKKEKKEKKRELEIDYFRQVEILYRQLKRNYEDNRDYAGAGDFHFGELEMRRKQKTRLGQWSSLILPYQLLSGYGEKWGRALVSFFIALFLFASLNMLWIQPKDKPASTWAQTHWTGRLVDSSLFTFKLMTLQRDLKYEAVDTPVWLGRVGKLALNLEFLIGPALIALMLLAIRRQFRR